MEDGEFGRILDVLRDSYGLIQCQRSEASTSSPHNWKKQILWITDD